MKRFDLFLGAVIVAYLKNGKTFTGKVCYVDENEVQLVAQAGIYKVSYNAKGKVVKPKEVEADMTADTTEIYYFDPKQIVAWHYCHISDIRFSSYVYKDKNANGPDQVINKVTAEHIKDRWCNAYDSTGYCKGYTEDENCYYGYLTVGTANKFCLRFFKNSVVKVKTASGFNVTGRVENLNSEELVLIPQLRVKKDTLVLHTSVTNQTADAMEAVHIDRSEIICWAFANILNKFNDWGEVNETELLEDEYSHYEDDGFCYGNQEEYLGDI